MNEQQHYDPESVATSISELVDVLNIGWCSDDLQLRFLTEWSELFLGRFILRIPEEKTTEFAELIDTFHAEGKDVIQLIDEVVRRWPELEEARNEEIIRAVNEFRLPETPT